MEENIPNQTYGEQDPATNPNLDYSVPAQPIQTEQIAQQPIQQEPAIPTIDQQQFTEPLQQTEQTNMPEIDADKEQEQKVEKEQPTIEELEQKIEILTKRAEIKDLETQILQKKIEGIEELFRNLATYPQSTQDGFNKQLSDTVTRYIGRK